jgi:hypothetical protein
MKNKIISKSVFPIILSLIFLSSLICIVSAQSLTPGVSKGDIFAYNYNVTWNSTDPTLPMPSVIADLTKIQSFQIQITSVSGTVVNAQVTTTYHDGTTETETGFVDVQSGDIHLPHGNLIIAGNLNANDKIYPSGGDATLNSTAVRTYQTGSRQTSEQLIETASENHYEKTDVYYDKTKGIAVSSYYESIDTFGSETETFTETITNTNADVWTVPEFPIIIVPFLCMIAVSLLLIAKKKHKIR